MTFGETRRRSALRFDQQDPVGRGQAALAWWVGKNARRWVINNIFGGTVTDGKIEVFLPMGRITRTVGPIDLNAEELNVQFNISDARINLAGDIPPLRDAAGVFTLKGERMDVEIQQGTAYFPSDAQPP